MSDTLPRRGVLTLLAGSALAGCGFQPVYMPTASGKAGVAERELAAIDVKLIAERPGQVLRQALQERFASDGGQRHRYELQVSFWIAGEAVGIQYDTSASRVRLIGTANWNLVALDARRTPLTKGSARSMDAFNLFDSQFFAADMENMVVQKRIAESVADQMALQLAVWFRKQANQGVG